MEIINQMIYDTTKNLSIRQDLQSRKNRKTYNKNMKRVKFFIIIGALIFATATSIAASRKGKSEVKPRSKSEVSTDTKRKSKKVRCWNTITSRNVKPGQTVLLLWRM